VLADEAEAKTTPDIGAREAAAPYCLTYGFAPEDETCADCSQLVVGYNVGRFVTVGRYGGARLCDTCAESSGLYDFAAGLDQLDTFVKLLPAGMNRAAAVMNVQAAVRSLLDQEWLPLVQADLEQARR